jgi:hypothetical protein
VTLRGASNTRILVALIAVAVIGAAAGAITFIRFSARNAPDATRLAVAPFDIFVTGLDAWRVSLAERVTQRLDADPAWTAVPQPVVAQRWRGQERPEIAALELARRTAAGLAVYGRVDSLGADSVRVNTLLIDALSTRPVFGVVLRMARHDSAAVADSLAGHILHLLAGRDSTATPH